MNSAAIVKQRWHDLPIIIATANSEELSNDVHSIPGVDCLLNKPFSNAQTTWSNDFGY